MHTPTDGDRQRRAHRHTFTTPLSAAAASVCLTDSLARSLPLSPSFDPSVGPRLNRQSRGGCLLLVGRGGGLAAAVHKAAAVSVVVDRARGLRPLRPRGLRTKAGSDGRTEAERWQLHVGSSTSPSRAWRACPCERASVHQCITDSAPNGTCICVYEIPIDRAPQFCPRNLAEGK